MRWPASPTKRAAPGTRPNRNVTPSVNAARESQHSPIGRQGQVAPDYRESRSCARRTARPTTRISARRWLLRRGTAIHALSTSTSCTSRQRPAPMETRSAISRARDAACAVIRFATFAQAINSTSPHEGPQSHQRPAVILLNTNSTCRAPPRDPSKSPPPLSRSMLILPRGISVNPTLPARFRRPGDGSQRYSAAARVSAPGFICTSVRSQVLSPRRMEAFIIRGTKTSTTVPVSVPVNSSGPTPTIWKISLPK